MAEHANSRHGLGSRLQYRCFERMIACRALPLARAMLGAVVLYYTLRPGIRKRCSPYLRRRFAGDGPWRMFWHAYRLYLQFGQALLDRMIAGITGRFPLRPAAPEIHELLTQAEKNPNGRILLSAHCGAWQLALAGLEQFDAAVNILQYPSPGDQDKHYFERGNGRPFHIIDATDPVGSLVEAASALRRGETLCLMGDRSPSGSGPKNRVKAPFLGDDIFLPIEAYVLASMTGASLLLLFCARDRRSIRPLLAEAISVPSGLSRRDPSAFGPFALRFAQALEDFVGRYPYQFFNFYDMWGTQ